MAAFRQFEQVETEFDELVDNLPGNAGWFDPKGRAIFIQHALILKKLGMSIEEITVMLTALYRAVENEYET